MSDSSHTGSPVPRRGSQLLWASALCLLALIVPGTAQAALVPEELAIIAMQASPESLDVARYYAAARKVPMEHILELPGPVGVELDRKQWETETAPFIRNWLKTKQLEGKIRCFVTVWDVPLKIGRRAADTREVAGIIRVLDREYARRVALMEQVTTAVNGILASGDVEKPEPLPPTAKPQDVRTRFDSAVKGSQERVAKVPGTPAARKAAVEFERQFILAAGFQGYAGAYAKAAESNHQVALIVNACNGQFEGLTAGIAALLDLPESPEVAERAILLRDKAQGLLVSLQWIQEYRTLVEANETYASFDSELSLLFWPEYPLLRERPNLLHYSFDGNAGRETYPTLMVSRLEAPTIELTKGLVDAAIETEKTGLTGRFYIDSRGIEYDGKSRGSYGDYDEALRHLDQLVQQETEWKVVFDKRPELFEPESCPDAALYCGWYSLAKYIDSFTWKRGAVAYHIASGEAATLRDANSEVWCKRMLEKGVCATLGPVHEPYLHTFPRPDEFFPALMSGRYTLVETYYRTLPSNSWVMVLIGDPLYRPFAKSPEFNSEEIPKELQRLLPALPKEDKAAD